MKKLMVIVLVIIMIIPAVATSGDIDVIGCWAHYELLTTGTPSMSMIYLAADHTCYYVLQSFKSDAPGLGRTYVGTWEMLSDGTVNAKTGNNATVQLYFSDQYAAALDIRTNQIYVNLSKFD